MIKDLRVLSKTRPYRPGLVLGLFLTHDIVAYVAVDGVVECLVPVPQGYRKGQVESDREEEAAGDQDTVQDDVHQAERKQHAGRELRLDAEPGYSRVLRQIWQ